MKNLLLLFQATCQKLKARQSGTFSPLGLLVSFKLGKPVPKWNKDHIYHWYGSFKTARPHPIFDLSKQSKS